MRLHLLKFVQSGLLTGMPSLIYNPFTRRGLAVPLKVLPKSLYLNFKLSKQDANNIQEQINEHTDDLTLAPITMFADPSEERAYYISVNVYNCSSPAFMNDNRETTRCEINTYIKDKDGNIGTLILDYLSNNLSMDPVNIFKASDNIEYMCSGVDQSKLDVVCKSPAEDIDLRITFETYYSSRVHLCNDLARHSDYIYYKNGIHDKLFYDKSLTSAYLKSPFRYKDFKFEYRGVNYENIDSVFYFEYPIDFIGCMWDNL